MPNFIQILDKPTEDFEELIEPALEKLPKSALESLKMLKEEFENGLWILCNQILKPYHKLCYFNDRLLNR